MKESINQSINQSNNLVHLPRTVYYEKNLPSDIPLSNEILNRLIKVSIFDIISYFICCNRDKKILRKIKFFQRAIEIIDEYIDITNIINMREQLDTLKIILLDEKEIEIFNSVFKHSFNKKIGADLLPVGPYRNFYVVNELIKKTNSKKAKRILNFIK